MPEKVIKDTDNNMKKAVEAFKGELSKIRTGKASPTLLDGIFVEYYSVKTPLNQVSTISTPEPRLIVIQPWDKSVLGEIEKEILKANIGLTPSNDGNVIRLAVPPLTEERRHEIVKTLKKLAEDSRVSIRQIRREAIDRLKALKKDGKLPEDDEERLEREMQKATDKEIAEIDQLLEKKEKEILEL
ncbi:TPA: ribosome recycling factor [candidate division WOR-3 bacterium]|jgi:ribosome recycling factor|uniref:Ribosome-recycling factor n=1 Tax=candidate division WOR-3 bacterium TaxID=2052148 RepID=A0A350H8Q0_UNCW3|nr:ribosome recycling factor [candidate division WOR-3 bacterium]